MRKAHPAAQNWSLETFAAVDHVLVTVIDGGRGLMDDLLAERGMSRRIALRLPHFYAAISIVATSDYVVTLPATLARAFAPSFDLVVLELPVARPPIETIGVWADALDKDPRTLWLRRLVREETRHIDGAAL
jgi:DNA-binding transcriptional LysR family regulator